jgi:hypothetical protein
VNGVESDLRVKLSGAAHALYRELARLLQTRVESFGQTSNHRLNLLLLQLWLVAFEQEDKEVLSAEVIPHIDRILAAVASPGAAEQEPIQESAQAGDFPWTWKDILALGPPPAEGFMCYQSGDIGLRSKVTASSNANAAQHLLEPGSRTFWECTGESHWLQLDFPECAAVQCVGVFLDPRDYLTHPDSVTLYEIKDGKETEMVTVDCQGGWITLKDPGGELMCATALRLVLAGPVGASVRVRQLQVWTADHEVPAATAAMPDRFARYSRKRLREVARTIKQNLA